MHTFCVFPFSYNTPGLNHGLQPDVIALITSRKLCRHHKEVNFHFPYLAVERKRQYKFHMQIKAQWKAFTEQSHGSLDQEGFHSR